MIKFLVLSTLLNVEDGNIYATIPDPIKIEARRRNTKGKRDRRRGGGGLR